MTPVEFRTPTETRVTAVTGGVGGREERSAGNAVPRRECDPRRIFPRVRTVAAPAGATPDSEFPFPERGTTLVPIGYSETSARELLLFMQRCTAGKFPGEVMPEPRQRRCWYGQWRREWQKGSRGLENPGALWAATRNPLTIRKAPPTEQAGERVAITRRDCGHPIPVQEITRVLDQSSKG